MNGKHSYQDKFKPYEIVSENRDPILGPNSPDSPAGFSRVQRRKWKLWINTLTGKMFTRKSKYENEWIEVAGGGCPDIQVEYDNHYFIGRNATVTPGTIIYGWDLTAFLPFMNQNVVIWFGEQNQVGITSVEQAYNSLQAIADYFQQNWLDPNYPSGYVLSIQGNILVLSWNGVGPDPYGISTFLFGAYDPISTNFILPNDVDGAYSFIDEISTPGTEILGECEVVKITTDKFDCENDYIFFTKPSQTITLDGTYIGWSNPEGVQWSNVPQRDNRSWMVFFNNLDTDGIGATSTSPVTGAFTSFNQLVTEINNQLIAYGSSYRVVAVGNDRLMVADINYNILPAGDPYFTAHAFNVFSLIIEDSVTNSDYLIKATNPKDVTLNNVSYQTGVGGMYKGPLGCNVQSVTGEFVDNTDPLNPIVDIPDATQFQRGLVSTGTQTFGGNKTLTNGLFVQGQTQFGGFVGVNNALPTSNFHLVGSTAKSPTVIASSYTASSTDSKIITNNGATAITITLPNPTTCIGREISISRAPGSTGAITVTNSGTPSLQGDTGTLVGTYTLPTFATGKRRQVKFTAVTIGATTSWLQNI